MQKDHYKNLAELIILTEGEVIQELYFYFKKFPLDADRCDEHDGLLIPDLESLGKMQDGLEKIFMGRHEIYDNCGVYDFDFGAVYMTLRREGKDRDVTISGISEIDCEEKRRRLYPDWAVIAIF